jgi:hypothetical protein
MANKVEIAPLNNTNFVDNDSRYINSTIFYYGDNRFITFETYKRKTRTPSEGDRFYVITKGTEYRPDLVALRAYGNVSFWWKILEANNMNDIWDFTAGTNIIIPDALT